MERLYEIRFAADILRRLGEELNPHPELGIIELVKNSYDADARRCSVEINRQGAQFSRIEIEDDGDGMTPQDIAEGWLVLGQSRKNSRERRSKFGRIPAGSKGLGRLAALRLGDLATLTTRPAVEPRVEYQLELDWRRFEAAEHVDDVKLRIKEMVRAPGAEQGSTIVITHMRKSLGRMDVKRLARAMLLLADPFGGDSAGFQPELIAPEFRDLEQLVARRYFDDAEYHLVAELDERGRASAKVVDWHGKVLFNAQHAKLSPNRVYECPPLRFDLWVFLLTSEVFRTRTTTLKEVREWLASFGGVHVYYNGLRVSPYGNEGHDWLDMNLARAKSPEVRPSTNTSIGRVRLTDLGGALEQKTDRSGFIENIPFSEMRSFCRAALDWMARRRLEVAEERRRSARTAAPTKTTRSRSKLLAAVEAIPDRERRREVEEAVHRYDGLRNREIRQLHREVQLYRTLSTAGITAATFAHETSGNPIKIIDQSLKAIERRGRKALGPEFESTLAKPVGAIVKALSSLTVLSSATLRLLDYSKRRAGRVDLHSVVTNVLDTFEPFLAGRDVRLVKRIAGGRPYLRGSEAAIESIVTNLLNNSLASLEYSDRRDRLVMLETEIVDGNWVMRVRDNGTGIEGIELSMIWLPGETTRSHGTGLGLTIVRDTVEDLGGAVGAVAHHPELGGAEVTVSLPLLGA